MFNAIKIFKDDKDHISCSLNKIDKSELPDNNVLLNIEFSTLNYKDCLAIANKSPVVRKFPMVPGIDLAGSVVSSSTNDFSVGQKVVLNGWGHGEVHWGGLAQMGSIDSKYLIKLPANISTFEAMALGTAGYTATLAILEIEKKKLNKSKEAILVTGTGGGVGGIAVSILNTLGYNV